MTSFFSSLVGLNPAPILRWRKLIKHELCYSAFVEIWNLGSDLITYLLLIQCTHTHTCHRHTHCTDPQLLLWCNLLSLLNPPHTQHTCTHMLKSSSLAGRDVFGLISIESPEKAWGQNTWVRWRMWKVSYLKDEKRRKGKKKGMRRQKWCSFGDALPHLSNSFCVEYNKKRLAASC